jgi:hypothetical protein
MRGTRTPDQRSARQRIVIFRQCALLPRHPPRMIRRRFPRGRTTMDISNGSYFVGWGTLSLVNAGLAQGKGRSGLNWWLISLLLGPIATLLIVFLDPVAKKAD